MLLISAMFAQESESIDVLLEFLPLALLHALENVEKLPTDELGPVEPFFVVVIVQVWKIPRQEGYIFGSKQPAGELFYIAYLAVLSIFLEQAVEVVGGSWLLQFLLQGLEDPFFHQLVMSGQVSSHSQVVRLEVVELFHPPAAEETVVELVFALFLVGAVDLAEGVPPPDVLVVLIHPRVDFVL